MSVKLGFRERTISAALFCGLLYAVVSVDANVRQRVGDLLGGGLARWGDRLGDLGSTLWTVIRDRSLDNEPTVVFVAVGAVLTLFMIKS
ncbi:MAG: hypothetical protein ACRD1V_07075 [Vicinamibacterales bacterium]